MRNSLISMTLRKRRALEPVTAKPLLPTQQSDDNNSSVISQQNQKFKPISCAQHLDVKTTRRKIRCCCLAIIIAVIATLGIIIHGIFSAQDIFEMFYDTIIKPSDQTLYGSPSNVRSKFISKYEEMLISNKGVTVDHLHFVPLLLDDGKLLCRRRHKHKLPWLRSSTFIQMIRMGLMHQKTDTSSRNNTSTNELSDIAMIEGGLPILLTEGDHLYCNVATKTDSASFPRLSWSIVAPKHGNWCETIGIPSYETWYFYHNSFKQRTDWESKFQENNLRYPWSEKADMAVWRGSSTFDVSQYSQASLNETPRGHLVKKGLEYPSLIDAGFTKIYDKFVLEKNETRLSEGMSMNDMMRYKAIIDIDGNNWSSRFGMLLCMNSVIIKIDPDYIEFFYQDLQPMVHYIPATLQNISQAVKYVIDKDNEQQVQSMINAANSWCQETLIEPSYVNDAMTQLNEYEKALDRMEDETWRDEWKRVKKRFTGSINDFVDCDTRNIVSYFSDLIGVRNMNTIRTLTYRSLFLRK